LKANRRKPVSPCPLRRRKESGVFPAAENTNRFDQSISPGLFEEQEKTKSEIEIQGPIMRSSVVH
jgi:hypothetical protein